MKTFCILEQGRYINEPLTLKKKEMFTTDFSDFFRLNWYDDNDPNAFITAKGAVWSEGRSLLYAKVPKNYEYYIFIDDDVDFYADSDINIPEKIKLLLDEYKPLAGTFFNFKQWGFKRTGIPQEQYLARKCFPIAGHDMESHILSQSFAEVVFPVIYHGAHRSMWYSYWICHQSFPLKQVGFTEIQVRGFRSEWHKKNRKDPKSYEFHEILGMFNRHIKDPSSAIASKEDIVQKNIAIFNQEVDRTLMEFTFEDLERIYNTKNFDFKIRSSVLTKLHLLRKSWNQLLRKIVRKLKK